MILFKTSATLTHHLEALRKKNQKIGFVPTMGALHDGHISLIKQCKNYCDIVVCSIFVNPTQFNDKKDFEKYPVTIEHDIYLLQQNQTDILFLPSVNEIYADGLQQLQHFNLGYLETILEGQYRPGHFQGVCNVVYRLLKMVLPDMIFLGQKDYQQYLVLKLMMQDFFSGIDIMPVDIAREKSGLAMSSRNMRLSESAKESAAAIHENLLFIKENIFLKNFEELKAIAEINLAKKGFDKIDYIELCDAETLLPIAPNKNKKLIVLIAAFIEEVRLIDNLLLN